MRKAKVDKNQPKVVQELRDMGFTVGHTHMVGKGFPDFIVGYLSLNLLVELKSENGTLTEDEIKFHKNYKGNVTVAYSTLDIVEGFLQHSIKLDDGREPSFQTLKLSEILKELNDEEVF